MENKKTYWAYGVGGEKPEGEFDSYKKAREWAEDEYSDQCKDDYGHHAKSGDEICEDITFLEFTYDEEDEIQVVQEIEDRVCHEFYHGDLAEHGLGACHYGI